MVFADGPDFVVTVRHGSLGRLREDLEADHEQLAKGPSTVLHAIADHVVDDYLTVTDAVHNDMDAVETEVFSPSGNQTADAGRERRSFALSPQPQMNVMGPSARPSSTPRAPARSGSSRSCRRRTAP